MEYNVGKCIPAAAGSVIFDQRAKIIQYPELFLDDVFLDGAKIKAGKNVNAFFALCHFEHEFEKTNRGLPGRGSPL